MGTVSPRKWNQLTEAQRYEVRRIAVKAVWTRTSDPARVAERLVREYGLRRQTLYDWIKRFKKGGYEALRDGKPSGRHAKLATSDVEWLIVMTRNKKPAELGVAGKSWTGKAMHAALLGHDDPKVRARARKLCSRTVKRAMLGSSARRAPKT